MAGSKIAKIETMRICKVFTNNNEDDNDNDNHRLNWVLNIRNNNLLKMLHIEVAIQFRFEIIKFDNNIPSRIDVHQQFMGYMRK